MGIGEFWPQDGCTHLYHLENTSDSSGNSYTLTNSGSVTFTNGMFGAAADLGSTNSSKSLYRSSFASAMNADHSLFCWIKNLSDPTTDVIQTIVRLGSSASGTRYSYLAYLNDAGTLGLGLRASRASPYDPFYAINLDTNWHFVGYTRSSSTAYLYYDGIMVGSNSFGTSTTSTYNIVIGANSTHDSDYFKGYIEEVVFLTRALSAQEVRQWYGWCKGLLM